MSTSTAQSYSKNWRERFKQLPTALKLKTLESLTDAELLLLNYDWGLWARPNQLAPSGSWSTWLILAGRGFGKTRTGAEFVRQEVNAARAGRVALIAEDAADARDVMVKGESGLLAISSKLDRPEYTPSTRSLCWPNGAIGTIYSNEDYESLRGPQHDLGWIDELAKFRYQRETWDNYQMGLRLGVKPRTIITTTPKPTKLLKEIIADPHTHVTRGSTFDNRANLPAAFFEQIIKRYEGTRIGRQELYAEMLEDTDGALWHYAMIETTRLSQCSIDLRRVVVAIDPATTADEDSCETGIIVAGRDDEKGYILADESLRGTPRAWALRAIQAFRTHKADVIVAEANNGGLMIEETLRHIDPTIPVRLVHASRGKQTRAEPISALYEQGRIHHVGIFPQLEDQMCSYTPASKTSPDRMDALVWALTELFDNGPIMMNEAHMELNYISTNRDDYL